VKDQYVGDVNDYLKYSLLRALARAHSGRLQVCWMRTAPDGRTDGARLGYLAEGEPARALDPLVFDELTRIITAGKRSVNAVQRTAILPGAQFHPAPLGDQPAARKRHFSKIWRALGPRDLVFFDPDNGLEVASVRAGARNCSKYVFLEELAVALDKQRSVCVYQHFPRVKRAPFIAGMLARLQDHFPDHRCFAIASPWVVHLICAHPGAALALYEAAEAVAARSADRLAVTRAVARNRRSLT
jgi:hypothetical protein